MVEANTTDAGRPTHENKHADADTAADPEDIVLEEKENTVAKVERADQNAFFSMLGQFIRQPEEQKGLTAKTLQEQKTDLLNTLYQLRSQKVVSHLASEDILGVWRCPITQQKKFTMKREELPKPKIREMNIINPNKPAELIEGVEDGPRGEVGIYTVDQSATFGCPDNTAKGIWPDIQTCQT